MLIKFLCGLLVQHNLLSFIHLENAIPFRFSLFFSSVLRILKSWRGISMIQVLYIGRMDNCFILQFVHPAFPKLWLLPVYYSLVQSHFYSFVVLFSSQTYGFENVYKTLTPLENAGLLRTQTTRSYTALRKSLKLFVEDVHEQVSLASVTPQFRLVKYGSEVCCSYVN